MSESFTASNGFVVKIEDNRSGVYLTARGVDGLMEGSASEAGIKALREFFLHEVGAWLDTETEALVVRCVEEDDEDGSAVMIFIDGVSAVVWEHLPAGNNLREGIKERYFAAHPVPKPWHDAKPGEVWEFTHTRFAVDICGDNAENLVVALFVKATVGWRAITRKNRFLEESSIVSGRRIWPEGDSDE